jgi:hypothetical protein
MIGLAKAVRDTRSIALGMRLENQVVEHKKMEK